MSRWKVATSAWASTLQCLQAPRVSNHEIDSAFLERGRPTGSALRMWFFLKLGQVHGSLLNKSPHYRPQTGLL